MFSANVNPQNRVVCREELFLKFGDESSGFAGRLEMFDGSWERWRLAGEFRYSAFAGPAGRRRSREVHGHEAR
jgi:hypothetical protein